MSIKYDPHEIIVIENFFDDRTYHRILESVESSDMNWYYSSATTQSNSLELDENERFLSTGNLRNWILDNRTLDTPQHTHLVNYDGEIVSNYNDVLEPALYKKLTREYKIEVESISRIKFNSILKDTGYPAGYYNTPHIDSVKAMSNNWSLLVYLNDSDGDTYLFNQFTHGAEGEKAQPHDGLTIHKTITPKANTAVLFHSDRWHASSPPRKTERRLIISYVFMRK